MKCQKWIKTNHFPIKNNIISSQKKFQPNRSFLRPPEFPLKFGSDPFKGEKKNSDYGVYGIQIDRLGLKISTQNRFWKICTESRDNGGTLGEIGGVLESSDFAQIFLWAYHIILNGKMICFYSFLTFHLFLTTLGGGVVNNCKNKSRVLYIYIHG